MQKILSIWSFVFLCFLASGLKAQAPSEIISHELQRQQEQDRIRREQIELQAPDIHFRGSDEKEGVYPLNESPCVLIKDLRLEGEMAEKFQWALKASNDAKGLCLGSRGVNVLMSRVQNSIIKKGYLTTRVVASPQDLNRGIFIMTLIPGKVSAVKFSKDSHRYVHLGAAVPARPGKLLNIRDVEQGLENLKGVPTATADIEVVLGEMAGESEIVISWKQTRPFRLSLSADDSGSESTGKYQGNATLSVDNIFGFSDMFYVSYSRSLERPKPFGSDNFSFYYSIPFGYNTLTFNSSEYNYHQQVAGIFKAYKYSGWSRNTSLDLSRVIHRGGKSKTSLLVSGFSSSSKNYVDNNELEVQRRRMSGWETALKHRHYIGPLTVDGEFRYHRGTGAFSAMPAPEEKLNEGTSRPEILSADFRFTYPFQLGETNLRYLGRWRQQWAFDKLVSKDRFSIGGRHSVRGYSGEMTLSADNGFFFRNELGLALFNTGHELYVGFDIGRVWGGPMDEHLLGKSLSGASVGLRGAFKNINFDVFASTPVNKPSFFPGDGLVTGFNVSWHF